MPPPEPLRLPPEIDERWLPEWVAYGFADIASYLTKHLAFARWCDSHPQQEDRREA